MTMVATAGRVGTPDWQLDRMYETDTARILEKAYREDDFPISSIKSEFDRANYYIGLAIEHFCRAANEAELWGRDQPINDLIDVLQDDFRDKTDKVIRDYQEGRK